MQKITNTPPTSQHYKLISFNELNLKLDAVRVLAFIGYHKSDHRIESGRCRDYCPIHKSDNRRSLSIDMACNTFHCHACAASGDLIGLVAQALDISNKDAAEQLKAEFNIESRLSRTSFDTVRHTDKKHNTKRKSTNTAKKRNSPETLALVEEKWNAAKECFGHRYLIGKKEKPAPGLRYGLDEQSNPSIVVPFRNIEGKLTTLQYVNCNGKYFLKDVNQEDSFFSIGDIANANIIFITEGLATALTVWRALGKKITTVAIGSVYRMSTVVEIIHRNYPNLQIIVCLDLGEDSIKQAQKIQDIPNVLFCKPNLEGMASYDKKTKNKLTDFNDIISKCNQSINIVTNQLKNIKKLEDIEE